jgi:molybdenum cofactor cytidylyltransferase
MYVNTRFGVIILAAGNSSRMGEPKQVLPYHDSTLLLHAVDVCVQVDDAVVAVVTGASKETVEAQVAGRNVTVIYNADWETGMCSSIRTGVAELLQTHSFIEGILITVCDQPFLTTDILRSLIDGYLDSDKGIIASAYDDAIGTPVLFSSRYFSELMDLQGQEGAKKIVLQHMDDVVTKPFPRGGIDIDTKEDYQRLLNQ